MTGIAGSQQDSRTCLLWDDGRTKLGQHIPAAMLPSLASVIRYLRFKQPTQRTHKAGHRLRNPKRRRILQVSRQDAGLTVCTAACLHNRKQFITPCYAMPCCARSSTLLLDFTSANSPALKGRLATAAQDRCTYYYAQATAESGTSHGRCACCTSHVQWFFCVQDVSLCKHLVCKRKRSI